MAKLVSVNVGLPRPIDTPRGPVQTAIFKSPTEQRLQVEAHNLEGDRQADLSVQWWGEQGGLRLPNRALPALGCIWSLRLGSREDHLPERTADFSSVQTEE
jgi:hypothetical protein